MTNSGPEQAETAGEGDQPPYLPSGLGECVVAGQLTNELVPERRVQVPPRTQTTSPAGPPAGDVCVSGPSARRQACLGPQSCAGRLVGRMPSSGTGAGWRSLRSTASRRSGCPQALHCRVRLRPGWIHGVLVRGCGRNSGEYRLGSFRLAVENMRARRPVRGRVPRRVINVGRGYVGAKMNIQGPFLVPMTRWPGMRGAGWPEGRDEGAASRGEVAFLCGAAQAAQGRNRG